MTFRAMAALGGALILGAGGVILGLGGDKGPGDVGSTAAVQQRAVRLPGTCPVVGPLETAKCDHVDQQDGWCLCWTKQEAGTVDGEQDATSVGALPAKDRKRLVACTVKDAKDKNVCETRWEDSVAAVALNCSLGIEDSVMPGISSNGVEFGTNEEQLRQRAGCPVSAGHWGHAPCCLRTDVVGYEGGCAAVCPPAPDGGPK